MNMLTLKFFNVFLCQKGLLSSCRGKKHGTCVWLHTYSILKLNMGLLQRFAAKTKEHCIKIYNDILYLSELGQL